MQMLLCHLLRRRIWAYFQLFRTLGWKKMIVSLMQTGWIKQWEEHKDAIQGQVCSPATAAGRRSAGRADASAVTLTVSESIPAGCLLTLNNWKVWLSRKCWSWDCYMTCLPGSWTDKVQAPLLSSLFLSSSQSVRETLSSLVPGSD